MPSFPVQLSIISCLLPRYLVSWQDKVSAFLLVLSHLACLVGSIEKPLIFVPGFWEFVCVCVRHVFSKIDFICSWPMLRVVTPELGSRLYGLCWESDTSCLFCTTLIFHPHMDFPTFSVFVLLQYFLLSCLTALLGLMGVLNLRWGFWLLQRICLLSFWDISKILSHYWDPSYFLSYSSLCIWYNTSSLILSRPECEFP